MAVVFQCGRVGIRASRVLDAVCVGSRLVRDFLDEVELVVQRQNGLVGAAMQAVFVRFRTRRQGEVFLFVRG